MFCLMQFTAQTADYEKNYPAASFQIIERDGVAAGRLLVMRSDDAVHVIDIALLPELRVRGIVDEPCPGRAKRHGWRWDPVVGRIDVVGLG